MKDLVPVAMIGSTPNLLVVSPVFAGAVGDGPARDRREKPE